MDTTSYESEYDYLDEEEIDIVKLVSTNANDANQYLLFHGKDEQYYAKNVSKIEEIVVFKTLDMVRNYDDNLIVGVADVRGEMLSLVSFDSWLGASDFDEKDTEFVIIVNYGGEKFGLLVKNVEYITTIEPNMMQSTTSGNSKSTFTTKIALNNSEHLCTIIDSDKLLFDTFEDQNESTLNDLQNIKSIDNQKMVLLADDSRLIQNLLKKVCLELNLNYKILSNGEQLLQEMKKYTQEEIGLVVTDVEMPILGGKEVIKKVRNESKYDELNILVHTNMANDIMKNELMTLGANEIICKVDIQSLSMAIKKYIK